MRWYGTMPRLPAVQLIGAQKAGTSALADWIFDQGRFTRPRVFEGEPWFYSKEVHFFDIDSRFTKGIEFYEKRFEESTMAMDATPDTLAFPDRVYSVYEAAGEVDLVKIIVILREPIARELSLYNHLAHDWRTLSDSDKSDWNRQVIKPDGTLMDFQTFVESVSIPAFAKQSGPGRSTRYSMYALHLQKWFELFDRQQILVLSYDELKNHPTTLQYRVRKFLGHPIPGDLRYANSNDNPLKVNQPPLKVTELLSQILDPLNEDLYSLLEQTPGPPMEQHPFPRFASLPP
jgi:hypothetical protein